MPAPRMPMKKIRDVLRLHFELKLSRRQIARSLSLSRDTVAVTIARAAASGLAWPLPDGVSDQDLERRLYPPKEDGPASGPHPEPDWLHLKKELGRTGVTRRLLWEEYQADHEGGLCYSQFCYRYRQWLRHVDPAMRMDHKAGEKLFVDYAGDTMSVIDPETGEIREAQLFVAVLGTSSYLYAEATWTQQLQDWVMAHVRALDFLGGVPKLIVPDNTRTAVKHSCYYEPSLNRTYADLAAHYGTAILPTRVRKPKDKAKVEAGVLHVERRILAKLRNRQFFSLAQLNEAIDDEVDVINGAPFQKLEGSRLSQFEALDKPALLPLPAHRYTYATWHECRAGVNYHLELEKHGYSVPYQLIRRKLNVRVTASVVEVFYRGERVASHARSSRAYGYTTVREHMPSSHRRYAEWTPERITGWAAKVGEATAEACAHIMRSRPHPEHGFRACLGIMRLAKRYGDDRTEAACQRALAAGAVRYKSIESILARGLDKQPLLPLEPPEAIPNHEHIRGPEYYN